MDTFPGKRFPLDEDQSSLASLRHTEPSVLAEDVGTIGGCSQLSLDPNGVASTVLSFEYPGLEPYSGSFAFTHTDALYEPTYLTYREGPALIKALDQLPRLPDVLLVPAAGKDHPRGMGMARHIGLIMSLPTIGITRRPLAETNVKEFSPGTGRATIFVSPGWGIDETESLRLVADVMWNHRTPEPIYLAKRVCRRNCLKMGLLPTRKGSIPSRSRRTRETSGT
jgi:deoxyribonuclease V